MTYLTRIGGIWLMGRVTPSPRVEAWLRNIPGAVLVAIVAPDALTHGPADALAAVAQAGAKLVELRRLEGSLEDVFVHLTGRDLR